MIALSIQHILSIIYAESALGASLNADRRRPFALLTSDNSPALMPLVRLAFAQTVMEISKFFKIKDYNDGSSDRSDIMSIELDGSCPQVPESVLVRHLENAVVMLVYAHCYAQSGDDACTAAFKDMARDALKSFEIACTGFVRTADPSTFPKIAPRWW